MPDTRQKDCKWSIDINAGGYSAAHLAVLMDIRDELKVQTVELTKMNSILHCSNFLEIPQILRKIRGNTAKPRASKASV